MHKQPWTVVPLGWALCLYVATGCAVNESSFFEQVQSQLCDAYSNCCSQHGWNNGWSHGMCLADSSPPSWIDAEGGNFVPSRADACLARIAAWIPANVDCATQGSEEYSASGVVTQLCPDLYVGGSYQTTPLGSTCSGISPCVPSPYGPTTCAAGAITDASGTSNYTECVVDVATGVLGDVCGSVSCPTRTAEGYNCLPSRPSAPRWADACGPGLTCDVTHHCATMPTAAVGESCARLPCADGAWCQRSGSGEGATAVCAPDATTGQACASAYEPGPVCDSQSYCGSTGLCTAPPMTVATGAACDGTTTLCPSLDFCDPTVGVCVAKGISGAPCAANQGCLSGACVNGRCTRNYPPVVSDCA